MRVATKFPESGAKKCCVLCAAEQRSCNAKGAVGLKTWALTGRPPRCCPPSASTNLAQRRFMSATAEETTDGGRANGMGATAPDARMMAHALARSDVALMPPDARQLASRLFSSWSTLPMVNVWGRPWAFLVFLWTNKRDC